MDYYVSQYLNVYPSHRGTSLLFHGVTGSIDEVRKDIGIKLKSMQREKVITNSELSRLGLKKSHFDFLKERGHLTDLKPSEEHAFFCKYAEELHEHVRVKAQKRGYLMLVPSYYCNLACPYCFQNTFRNEGNAEVVQTMSPKTVDAIFQSGIHELFPELDDYSKIQITLYGGEPFLERNRPALERIIRYTQKYRIEVSAISNASQLETFLPLFGKERGKVSRVQISFDGDKLRHDQTRITHYGGGTFDKIVSNIQILLAQGTNISVRVNTHEENAPYLPLLIDCLRENGIADHPLVDIHGAAVHDHLDEKHPVPIFTRTKLSKQIEAQKVPVKSPLEFVMDSLEGLFDKSKAKRPMKTNFCMQNKPQSYLIDHLHDIYGCYEEAGKSHLKIGEMNDKGNVEFNNRYQVYQSRHVGKYDPCSRCPVALTCGGGCPVAARGPSAEAHGVFQQYCDSHKELVAKGIQKLFRKHLEASENEVQNVSSGEVSHGRV